MLFGSLEMGLKFQVFVLCLSILFFTIAATTNSRDAAALNSLKDIWKNFPPSWRASDPCEDWVGIRCSNSRVISITLPSMKLSGPLSGDITTLSELQILDLSYNKDLTGSLPTTIGDLKNLTSLILVGCGLSGPIPDSIGHLSKLVYLSLNSNSFIGPIPRTIGNLAELYWLDLADNKLTGTIPVSSGKSPGLDMLVHTKHFHLGKNQLSGTIPEQLFSSNMVLIHVLFDSNSLTGTLPTSLGLVQTLEVVRFDRNQLNGPVPSNLNNLSNVNELFLSNNKITGSIPDLSGLNSLNYLDMSNNSFDPSDFPTWFSTLQSLTTWMMDKTQLQGQVPPEFFSLPHLQTVLQSNPLCEESGETKDFCIPEVEISPYSTQSNNCIPGPCSSAQISSPNCHCAYPYTGTLAFRAPPFSDLENFTYFTTLEEHMVRTFQSYQLPVDSISLSKPHKDSNEYLNLTLRVFPPYDKDSFNRTGVSSLGFVLSNQTYKPPHGYGPYIFMAEDYQHFAGESRSKKSTNIGIIIGAAAGGCVLLLLLIFVGVYAHHQKKIAQKANKQNPFAHWDQTKSSGNIPQLKGARCFSFEEVNKYTNHFSEANVIGSGGYGKVYKGTLPTGELVAVKRAQQGSIQGGQEFKTEIELLSRVHHKNLVGLYGFCFERGEQMLIYEYVPNGSLKDSLSGKTGIRMDWLRRLKITLGAARGLAYLHELADPPIIHRDIKSTNILLDERLIAKVADFGLSRAMIDPDKGHVSTQVKGTMGYLDPEYYMTQQLTEKSDVYSFGVLMLELITGRRPIERGKYIVREIKTVMDKNKDLYNLYELLDPTIGLGTTLKGFGNYVDVAMSCVQESGADRPTMSEVVKEIENILQIAGLNPNAESSSTSASYDDASKDTFKHPYGNDVEAFEYSGGFLPSKVEPQ
ncbi:leucine-rich repeat receptor protein kinase HPCA1-like isoform X2 [Mangifera indica]|uniref:leucine-rich repeat receptor protein kinase HPCA1-like isoform X2 n=1 Tax=Mangifera indica TaxID=29780 RepID=UPI001CF9F3C3|nr:leucine-rich repeat receptor protein kinase HPCA1-like isoform X2 [Mangifera indica]